MGKRLLESEYLDTILKLPFGEAYLHFQMNNLNKWNKDTASISEEILLKYQKHIDYVKLSDDVANLFFDYFFLFCNFLGFFRNQYRWYSWN